MRFVSHFSGTALNVFERVRIALISRLRTLSSSLKRVQVESTSQVPQIPLSTSQQFSAHWVLDFEAFWKHFAMQQASNGFHRCDIGISESQVESLLPMSTGLFHHPSLGQRCYTLAPHQLLSSVEFELVWTSLNLLDPFGCFRSFQIVSAICTSLTHNIETREHAGDSLHLSAFDCLLALFLVSSNLFQHKKISKWHAPSAPTGCTSCLWLWLCTFQRRQKSTVNSLHLRIFASQWSQFERKKANKKRKENK